MDGGLLVIPRGESIQEETPYETLNRSGFVRAESAQHQWYLLVTEAYRASKIPFDETMRDYLATMLYRFTNRAELFGQFAAFDYYQFLLGIMRVDSALAQDIADISLQYVAFFPERSHNRHEPRSLEHVANMGESMYRKLAKSSRGKDDWFSHAFGTMSTSFARAVMVLRSAIPRFALRRQVRQERRQHGAMHLLSISERVGLAPEMQRFGAMYFEFGGDYLMPQRTAKVV